MKVTLTKHSSITLDAVDLWSAVMGSGWETWPWWQSVKYLEGDWDVPGRVQVAVANPDDPESSTDIAQVDLDALILAVKIVAAGDYVDACTGQDIDWEDVDACVGDLVMQIAVLGEETYA